MSKKLYQQIASTVGAYHRCIASNNQEWTDKHLAALHEFEKELPSGSGIDSGTKIDVDVSGDEKIVLLTAYHHMDENGMYDGWTEHKITVTPSFSGFHLAISGRDRNGIKDYLHDTYSFALDAELQPA